MKGKSEKIHLYGTCFNKTFLFIYWDCDSLIIFSRVGPLSTIPLVYPDFMANQVTQAPRGAMDGMDEMDSRDWTEPRVPRGQ